MCKLNLIEKNKIVKIVKIINNSFLTKRIIELGLYPTKILKIKNNDNNNLIVEIDNSQFIINNKLAENIYVDLV